MIPSLGRGGSVTPGRIAHLNGCTAPYLVVREVHDPNIWYGLKKVKKASDSGHLRGPQFLLFFTPLGGEMG